MDWYDFYDGYTEWAESTLRTRISSLKDMGTGEEIVEVLIDLPAEKLKVQLLRKAIAQKVQFTHEDFENLDGELPEELYRELATYAGFDADNPFLDEDDLTWDDFYSSYFAWNETDTLRRIGKLKDFGASDEVCEAICGMPDAACEEALYQKAIASGVCFSAQEKEEMGFFDVKGFLGSLITDEALAAIEQSVSALCEDIDRVENARQYRKGPGVIGTFFAAAGAAASVSAKKRDPHRCDGDCEHCPPHYGYRYGRWYYGHGHQYGCQRGGNGGAKGKTKRD